MISYGAIMSSHKAPFTAHLRVIASRGKRFETVRSLQRLAQLIYGGPDGTSGLIGNASIEIARPGGGQANQMNSNLDQTDYAAGCAVKPQFGETPAQLMIAGFYLVATANAQPWSDKATFSPQDATTDAAHSVSRAGGAWGWGSNPSTSVAAEVKALKAIIDGVIAAEVPGEGVTVWRVDYKGIVWGDRGTHFPD